MKTLKFILTVLMGASINLFAIAQSHDHNQMNMPLSKTESFKVWGKCDMCKERIEAALKLDGISKATWDPKTRMVTVTYDPSKITVDAMQKKLASIGHDTEKYKATDEAYTKLPGCCQYDRS